MVSFNLTSIISTKADIVNTADLPAGWCYGRGVPSTFLARSNADAAAALLFRAGAMDAKVFPDVDGGVMVTAYKGNESFEVLALSEGGFDVVFEDEQDIYASVIVQRFEGLIPILEARGWQVNPMSVSFHRNTMIVQSDGIIGSRSRTLPGTVAYQSSTSLVRSNARGKFANTLRDFIQGHSVDRPQHSGGFPAQNYLTARG